MKRFYFISFFAAIVLCLLNSCDDETTGTATYTGKVINEYTDAPLADVDVKVTNGDKIHSMTKTLDDGTFSIEVRLAEIDDTYYILIGNLTFETKKLGLPAFGVGEYYVGTIIVKGPTEAPVVETKVVRVDSKNLVFCEGEVIAVGKAAVTERGICWGTSTPTIKNGKIECGEGKGGFSCQIEDIPDVHEKNYYVRTYATNSYGTSYGETVMIDHRNPYNLYKLEDKGVSYLVLPYDLANAPMYCPQKPLENEAQIACQNLESYDYEDWDLPTLPVLELMCSQKNEIGGFTNQKYWSSSPAEAPNLVIDYYWYVDFTNGTKGSDSHRTYGVRPVRQY